MIPMDDPLEYVWRFSAVGLLVLANAFFVATEFALVGVRGSRMEALAKEGVAGARTVLNAVGDLDRYIAGTQLGITLASLALGWIGESALEGVLHYFLHFLPPALVDAGASAITAFLIITFLHVVLGELVPKSLALQHTEATALKVAGPMRVTVAVMRPMIWALNSTGALVLKMLGLSSSGDREGSIHSIEELKILVEDSHRHGILDEMERLMLHRVFKLKHLVARQVMIHRLDMVGIPVEMPYEGLMLAVVGTPYSKYPVYEGDLDHVVGILVVKDVIGYRRMPHAEPFELRKVMRAPLFVPENAPIETILLQFKKARMQMAIVLDEFGGTSGLVTLLDVTEELLGELNDAEIPGGSNHSSDLQVAWPVIVEGRTRLDVLNERYNLELEDEDADTLAGLVSNRLGRVPARGEEVVVGNVVIGVCETEGLRITSLSLQPLDPSVEGEEETSRQTRD